MKTSSRPIAIMTFVLLAFFVTTPSLAQTFPEGRNPAYLEQGSPAGSYALSGFETVNPFNGNLNFRLPLVEAIGRGGARVPSLLLINAKWTVTSYPDGERGDLYSVPIYNQDSWWAVTHNSYIPGVLLGRRTGKISGQVCNNGADTPQFSTTLTTLTFIGPDGTQFDLRDRDTDGRPYNYIGCHYAPAGRGSVWVTADGTSATFTADSDSPITDAVDSTSQELVSPSGYLKLSDGTTYRLDGGPITWIRDRNGNTTHFFYNSGNLIIKDSLNREIKVEYGVNDGIPFGLSDRITYKGFGGAIRTVHVSYQTLEHSLRPDQTLKTLHQLFPELNGSDSTQFNPTLPSSVWLPDGIRRYVFQYNSYGELARVTLPTGGLIEYDWDGAYPNINSSGVYGQNSGPIVRRVINRRSFPDGQLTDATVFMSISRPPLPISGQIQSTVTTEESDRYGNRLSKGVHYYYGDQLGDNNYYKNWLEGKEFKIQVYAADGSTGRRYYEPSNGPGSSEAQ